MRLFLPLALVALILIGCETAQEAAQTSADSTTIHKSSPKTTLVSPEKAQGEAEAKPGPKSVPPAPQPASEPASVAEYQPSEPAPQEQTAERGQTVTISRVVDGDTIEISPPIDGITDVRLIGVDTPETYGGVEPYGQQASAFTENALAGQRVALEFDTERVDQYGRLLAYAYLPDSSMFNETLVRQGYAQVATFPPNVRYTDRFLAAQEQARLEGAGLWGLPPSQLCELADRGNGIGGGCVTAPEPAPQPAPQPAPAPAHSAPATPSPPVGGDLDCADFGSLAEVQQSLAAGDPHGLDADGDGRACESNF